MFGFDPPWNWVSTRYRHPARLNKQTLTTIDITLQAGLSGPVQPKNRYTDNPEQRLSLLDPEFIQRPYHLKNEPLLEYSDS